MLKITCEQDVHVLDASVIASKQKYPEDEYECNASSMCVTLLSGLATTKKSLNIVKNNTNLPLMKEAAKALLTLDAKERGELYNAVFRNKPMHRSTALKCCRNNVLCETYNRSNDSNYSLFKV